MTKLYSFNLIINNHPHYKQIPEEGNLYCAGFCFLEGLSTITSIVEGFSVVRSQQEK